MPTHAARRYRWRLCALFYLAAQAQALWYVPFSKVLRAYGLDWLIPYAFACAAIAALVSPMIGGALAGSAGPRHAGPVARARCARRLLHGGALQHAARGVLSVHAALPERFRRDPFARADVAWPGDGGDRRVHPRAVALALSAQAS